MGQYGVVEYLFAREETLAELRTSQIGGFRPMPTNPCLVADGSASTLEGRVLAQGAGNIAIFLNGEYSNNLFEINKGSGHVTFRYTGSKEFIRTEFLLGFSIL